MKFYLAACYPRRLELKAYAEELIAEGHMVWSRWVFGAHELIEEDFDSLKDERRTEVGRRFAEEDLEDLREADVLIVFTELPGEGTWLSSWMSVDNFSKGARRRIRRTLRRRSP